MNKKIQLTESQETYLEAIYHIANQKGAARAKDIAQKLNVRASSVTTALKNLGKLELINYTPYDIITLTRKGKSVAKEIHQRHTALHSFLVDVLGVEAQEADDAAARMEHSVPKSIIERLIQYSEYVKTCNPATSSWDSEAGYSCEHTCSQKTGLNKTN